ncbi:MAG: fasciclin domain-containing protein, partial [Chloroflexi bacterium]|nr:fasciclin domain-containing protein [Chloroflexota bacterium]
MINVIGVLRRGMARGGIFIAALALVTALVAAACDNEEAVVTASPTPTPVPQAPVETTSAPEPVAQADIVDIAVGDGRFGTLVAALEAAGLVGTLQGEGPFTVFAPTDEAFAKLPEGTVESLLGDIPALTDILLYHVVAGAVSSEQVVTLDSAETVQGESLAISVDGGTVSIGEATVLIADIEASNGVIHVIDTVLIPQPETAMEETTEPEPVAQPDIVELAVNDGRFTTLVAALEAAGLVETLQGEGPFTVFAPTDEAFASLPEGTVEALLGDIP